MARFIWPLMAIVVWASAVFGRIHKPAAVENNPGSFLWRVETSGVPSYFFGTIHVPYVRVWDAIPENAKQAFALSNSVFIELNLMNAETLQALSACQLLPSNQHLSQVLPSGLYARLKIHMEFVRTAMPGWMTQSQRDQGLDASYLFSAITRNWERKRPIWVAILVNSLNRGDVSARGFPVLDLYLSKLARKNGKTLSAIETASEQCDPLNNLNSSQVIFALERTLQRQESLRLGVGDSSLTTDDLVEFYRAGRLDSVVFNRETIMFPSIGHKSIDKGPDSVTADDRRMMKAIDDYFRRHMLVERNKRMASRIIDLLFQHPSTSFFFALGAAHFVGNESIPDMVGSAGFEIRRVGPNETLPELGNRQIAKGNRNTVQGTFDDLSEEEKTRAYLQFLQYHQQLEQENETKKFQQMLNNRTFGADVSSQKADETSLKTWYGLDRASTGASINYRKDWPFSLAFCAWTLYLLEHY